MANVSDVKEATKTKTLHLVLLTFATGGLFPLMWMYRFTPIIEEVIGRKFAGNTFLIWLGVCVGLGGALIGTGDEIIEGIAGILTVASWILYIVWAFKARAALQSYALEEHRVDLKMNPFYTFFLTIYYVNYCINDLPEAQRKQRILRGEDSQHMEVTS